jgi:hypothetical protein
MEGTIETFHTTDVMAFKRKFGDEEVVVLVNVRNIAKDITLPASIANSEWTNVITGESIILTDNVSLQAYEYLILQN